MIELKSVLHYYIGHKCLNTQLNDVFIIKGVNNIESTTLVYYDHEESYYASTCKPILRPISSLTDDEKVKWYDEQVTVFEAPKKVKTSYFDNVVTSRKVSDMSFTPAAFKYLLSIGIDLFQLLDTHQAIVHIDK